MSVCMTGPCHQPLSARIWELWPAWPIRQCHNISRDDTRRCDRVIGDVTRLRSLAPTSEHRDISLRDVPTCQSRPSENDSLCFLNSSVWIGIKQQDCWNTYIMNEWCSWETWSHVVWRLSWHPPDQFIIVIITPHIRTLTHLTVITARVTGDNSLRNIIFSHFLWSYYIDVSQRSRQNHITLAYFVAQE